MSFWLTEIINRKKSASKLEAANYDTNYIQTTHISIHYR